MSYSIQLRKLQEGLFEGKQAALAKAIGKSAAQVNQWLNGYRNLSDGMALQIEKKLGLPDGWLMSDWDLPENLDDMQPQTVWIDCVDVLASCGGGEPSLYEYPELIRRMEFPKQYIEKIFGTRSPDKLKIIGSAGDSMDPTIPPNSAVFIDSSINYFQGDGIYFFYYCGELYLKRLQRMPKYILAISDNKIYKPFEIEEEFLHEFNIIGRYIGVMRIDME